MIKLSDKNLKIKNENKKKLFFKFLFFLSLILSGVFAHQNAQAATSYFSPSSGNFIVGNIFTVNIFVNTDGAAVNNAEAVINFPKDLLEVVSVSKSGSIFSLWVEEPAFSNKTGVLSCNGGLPTPGYKGAAGKIFNVVFRAKKEGSASLIFSSVAVRANDGYGTNVFKAGRPALFNLISKEKLPPAPIVGEAPAAPQISSPTHQDQEKWYSNNNPEFTWDLPLGVKAVRLLYDEYPVLQPSVAYKPPIDKKRLEGIKDGIWYFHAQFSNERLGEIAHFRFQIDTEAPSRFDIIEICRRDLTEAKAEFIFNAVDKTSGIDYYQIQIDGGNPEIWRDDGNSRYKTSAQEPGKHILIAKVFDKAGNSLESSAEFTVEALIPPVITEYPKELQSGESLIARGLTYADSRVDVWLQREKDDPKSFTVKSDQNGKFTFAPDEKLNDGIYKLWAEVVNARGARSLPSEKAVIAVAKPAILRIGISAINYLAVIIPLLALIILLLFIIWHSWHKFIFLKKRLRKEVSEAESALRKSFDLLRSDVQEQVRKLEKTSVKRQLTKEEEKIIKQLTKDLNDAEIFVRKEIEDIEKEMK